MTFDDMLRQAFEETARERAEHPQKVYKKHRFSLAFKLWEFKTLRNLKKNRFNGHWTLRKARCAVIAIIAVVSLLVGVTAYAAVALIGRFGLEDKIDYSKVLIETHPSDKTAIEEYYGLPEEDGWELTNYDIVYFSSTLNYKRCRTLISVQTKMNLWIQMNKSVVFGHNSNCFAHTEDRATLGSDPSAV